MTTQPNNNNTDLDLVTIPGMTGSYRLKDIAEANYLDDDIREELHRTMSPCGAQEWMDAYLIAHEAKFGAPLRF